MLAPLLISLLNFQLLLFVPFVSSTYTLFNIPCDFANKIRNMSPESYHMPSVDFVLNFICQSTDDKTLNCLETESCKLITLITIRVFSPEFLPNNSIYFEYIVIFLIIQAFSNIKQNTVKKVLEPNKSQQHTNPGLAKNQV